MAFDKPTRVARFGGTSAAETANSAEPASGKKDLGWELDEEPPSSTFNWLHYRAYKWFRWLDERIDDVTTAVNLAIHAPPVALTSDDGGDLTLSAADSGTDADKNGGDATLSGGDATGIGSSSVFLAAATKGVTGTAARVAETYLKLNGLDLAGPTTYGKVEIPKSLTVFTPAGSDGPAIIADSSAGTARALTVRGEFISPATAPLGINPQTADPSSPLNGDVTVNFDSDHIAHYSAVAEPARFQNLDPLIKTLLADSDPVASSTAEKIFELSTVDILATIPADTLRVGSIISIVARGTYGRTATPTLNIRAWLNGLGGLGIGGVGRAVAGGTAWRLDTEITIRTIGAGGTMMATSDGCIADPAAADPNPLQVTPVAIDTTAANTFGIAATWSAASASNTAKMVHFAVSVR